MIIYKTTAQNGEQCVNHLTGSVYYSELSKQICCVVLMFGRGCKNTIEFTISINFE